MDDYQGTIFHVKQTRNTFADLDCAVCGDLFPSFERLATHMAARHGRPTPNEPGDVELPPTQSPVTRNSRPMAKKSAFPRPPNSQKENKSGGDDTRNPFLKASDIGKVGTEADVSIVTGSARTGPSAYGSGEQVIVTVRHKGKTFDFGMDPTKPNYRILYDAKGDPGKWKGTIPVKVLAGNSNYIAVQRIK